MACRSPANTCRAISRIRLTRAWAAAGAFALAIPPFLLHRHYSRGFDTDADDYAFASHAANDSSPERFAEVIGALQNAHPYNERGAAYLSTHPPTLERIMR